MKKNHKRKDKKIGITTIPEPEELAAIVAQNEAEKSSVFEAAPLPSLPENAKKPRSETRQKTSVIGVRVSPEERHEIDKAAEEAGLTVGSFLRSIALKKARTMPRKRPALDVLLLGQILGQLGKVGNNLNQIAKRLNERKGVGQERIILALKELSTLKEQLVKELRRENDSEG